MCIAAIGRRADIADIRHAEEILAQGGVMSWARHVTGQDPNDLTYWDKIRSIAVIPGTSNKANGDARTDDELWLVVDRTIDGNDYTFVEQMQPLDWGADDDYAWFVDCGGSGLSGSGDTPAVPGTPATYNFTYAGDVGAIYGVPLGDVGVWTTFTNGGDANNVGGGVVGIPYVSSPFVQGQTVRISGTTNYDGAHTLPAQNDSDELQITAVYVAETFDGTERVVSEYGSLGAGAGRIQIDDDGYLWYGNSWDNVNNTYCTRVDANDGTTNKGVLTFSTIPPSSDICVGLRINSDSSKLYVSGQSYLYKFDMAAGTEDWAVSAGNTDFEIDENGNAYDAEGQEIVQHASADGATTALSLMGQAKDPAVWARNMHDVHYDSTLGLVMGGGLQSAFGTAAQASAYIYNFCVRTTDDSAGDQVAVGDLTERQVLQWTITTTDRIHTDYITSDGSNIFILLPQASGQSIFKYSWDGSSLTEETSVTAIAATSADGIWVDLWGNVVVWNNTTTETSMYYYDSNDLSYLGVVDGYGGGVGNDWSGVGAIYIQGTIVADGALAVAGSGAVSGTGWNIGANPHLKDSYVCLYADGIPQGSYYATDDNVADWNDTYTVVIAGINYYSILETFPLEVSTDYGMAKTQKGAITDVRLDFYKSMGCNFGTSLTEYAPIQFSDDDFATALDAWTGYKIVTFPRGVGREPILYLWMWDPIPMCIRAMYPTMNVFFPGVN